MRRSLERLSSEALKSAATPKRRTQTTSLPATTTGQSVAPKARPYDPEKAFLPFPQWYDRLAIAYRLVPNSEPVNPLRLMLYHLDALLLSKSPVHS
jgi:hypothetical protein